MQKTKPEYVEIHEGLLPVFQLLTDIVVILEKTDQTFFYYFVNEAAEKIGIVKERVGTCHALYHEGDVFEHFQQTLNQVIQENCPIRQKVAHVTGDKEYVLDMTMTPYVNQSSGRQFVMILARDMTDQVQTQRLLKESEERLQKVLHYSPMGMVIFSLDGMISYANKSTYEALKATSSSQVIGRSIFEFIPRDEVVLAKERLAEVIAGKDVDAYVLQLNDCLNGGMYAEIKGILVSLGNKDEVIVMLRDVTERVNTLSALQESEEKYRLIAENTKDMIAITDAETYGRILYASPSHQRLSGCDSEDFIGMHASMLVHPEDRERTQTEFDLKSLLGEPFMLQYRYNTVSDSAEVFVESSFSPIFDEYGKIEKYLMISRDVTERRNYERNLLKLAYYDSLTGLPNRLRYREDLLLEIKRASKEGLSFGLIYLDIDSFKVINDTYGHDAGDQVLQAFSKRVRSALGSKGTLYRLAGDEFVIITQPGSVKEELGEIAESIMRSLSEAISYKNEAFTVSSSIGIALYPDDGLTRHELLKKADKAMYDAKQKGKNTYCFHS
ncbi:diguanylate cyclase domain-containing protein [Fictibacillus iocasae]|uniref:Diguanylate cyclase domain-containing protein n=1 Tax=Fictibacillus iocasae TaxID=2715437 RepID=A0ABW2NYA1_9BACL